MRMLLARLEEVREEDRRRGLRPILWSREEGA